MDRRGTCVALALALLVMGLPSPRNAAAAPAQTVTEGTVSTVDASALVIAARTGAQVRTLVTTETRIIRRQPVRFDQIKPRDFVGVAAKREMDGSLTAVAINIFPADFKGRVREGQFMMDTGNLMTNAMVFQNVRRIEGRTLYLTFPEGTAIINVPRDIDIFRLTNIRLSDVRPGMRVTVRTTAAPDGALTAVSVTVDDAAR
jgi:hypothetical protein